MTERPTIFALSSGRLPAAIAVVRISGSRAGAALEALRVKKPEPRKAGLARLRDPQTGELIDEALVLWFPGPNSETGEDVAELQLHGGPAVVAAALAALSRIDGLRPAEAGEFTRRAFENGKLDLTAVEGLADLVGAETESQRRLALRQMKGALGGRAEAWRATLTRALALVEARIDFSDEGDVPEDLLSPAMALVESLRAEIAGALADGHRGERLREGLTVAIAGPPNAGKSTLLNKLAQREVAIVSPHAGTTRDAIEVHLDLGGLPVTLVDTAGIRETDDPVEQEGVRRAQVRAATADLVLWLVDAKHLARHQSENARVEKENSNSELYGASWLVVNKVDLYSDYTFSSWPDESLIPESESLIPNLGSGPVDVTFGPTCRFAISAETGAGLDRLLEALKAFLEARLAGAESALITRARHRHALEQVVAALERLPSLAGQEDLIAEELRAAAAALGRLTGRIDVEDVLDVIFRDFCIGK